MAKLDRLRTKLTKIEARIAEIEAAYPSIVKYKSYSHNFGEIQTSYQEFGPVAQEYRQLLTEQEALEDKIDDLAGDENGRSHVAEF